MNTILDRDDFTIMKRAIYATQVLDNTSINGRKQRVAKVQKLLAITLI